MFDAIVVGSRCAGAPTAMLLARRGRRVLLVDRASFPSDTLSAHAIQPAGVARLARWGLLDRLVATGVPAVERMSFDFGPVCLRGTPPPVDGNSLLFAPRRSILDTMLVEAAAEAGAEVREDSPSKSSRSMVIASWASVAATAQVVLSRSAPVW